MTQAQRCHSSAYILDFRKRTKLRQRIVIHAEGNGHRKSLVIESHEILLRLYDIVD